jgi:ribosomal protein L37AE/L43A
MAYDAEWPSREMWDEINQSIKDTSPQKSTKQRKLEAEQTFASVILRWMTQPQITLRGISDNLINSISDDTNKYSQHLNRYHTFPQIKARKKKTFIWSKERRYFHLLLDVIGVGRKSLVKSTGMTVRVEVEDNWKKSIHSLEDIEPSIIRRYDARPKLKRINLNMSSLFKLGIHKRFLTRWWMEGKYFDGLTPMEYLQQTHEEISKQHIEGLDQEQNLTRNIRLIKGRFTRKFSPWLVEAINSYWFRVMVVEKENHVEIHSSSRRHIISSYEKFTICLIIITWFEDAFQASNGMERNILINMKFKEEFPSSKCHYSTAKAYIEKITRRLEKADNELPYSWYRFSFISSKIADVGETIANVHRCQDCQSVLKKQSGNDEWSECWTCPECGLVHDHLTEGSSSRHNQDIEYTTSNLNQNRSEKNPKSDWETKIDKYQIWVFLNATHISAESKARIKKAISKKVKSIKRYKNQN